MKKLTLDLDALVVESFATGNAGHGAGTVRGHTGALCVEQTNEYETCGAGGDSAASACGPCPATANTHCKQVSCVPTCDGVSPTCRYTCAAEWTCVGCM